MEIRCPQCSKASLSSDNPYGMVICQNCGWLGQAVLSTHTRLFLLKKTLKGLASICLLMFLGLATVQFVIWKDYSFQASWLLVKAYLGSDPESAFLELGAVCNSLKKFPCSEKMFSRVVDINPRNRQALANLAIVLTSTGQWKKALPHFTAYFSLGGNGYDVLYWYGRAVAFQDGPERGLDWYYAALALEPTYEEAAEYLIDELIRLDRLQEAQSLIGSMTAGHPDNLKRWKDRLMDLTHRIDEGTRAPASVTYPAISGSLYFLPVRLMPKGRVHFFTINKSGEYTTLRREILDENLVPFPQDGQDVLVKTMGEATYGKKINLQHFEIGPWTFENVEVLVCDSCDNAIGQSLLSHFEMESWQKHRVEFLTMTAKNSTTTDKN